MKSDGATRLFSHTDGLPGRFLRIFTMQEHKTRNSLSVIGPPIYLNFNFCSKSFKVEKYLYLHLTATAFSPVPYQLLHNIINSILHNLKDVIVLALQQLYRTSNNLLFLTTQRYKAVALWAEHIDTNHRADPTRCRVHGEQNLIQVDPLNID